MKITIEGTPDWSVVQDIERIVAAAGGGTVKLGPGDYRMGEPARLTGAVTLEGAEPRDVVVPVRAYGVVADERVIIAKQADVIDDLRAVLALLLDDPYRSDEGQPFCVWCHLWHPYGREEHAPDCPVLRRDELLGRAPVGDGLTDDTAAVRRLGERGEPFPPGPRLP